MSVEGVHVVKYVKRIRYSPQACCSICGEAGRLRKGWCNRHYQRFWRWGDPNYLAPKREVKLVKFSRSLWNEWLFDLNRSPDSRLSAGIYALRAALAAKEFV